MRRQLVAVATVLAAFVGGACANNITYSIVDYAVDQADLRNPGAYDRISGTIITDGTLGVWSGDYLSHIVGGSLVWQGPSGTYSTLLSPVALPNIPHLTATPAQLLVDDGQFCGLEGIIPETQKVVDLKYDRRAGHYEYAGVLNEIIGYDQLGFRESRIIEVFDGNPPPPGPGSIVPDTGPGDPWVIATAASPPLLGDATGDGTVDISDLSIVLTNYNDSDMSWSQGDFTGDLTVDINDLSIILTNYNTSAAAEAGINAIPEPSTIILSLAGAVGLLAYAWRRRS